MTQSPDPQLSPWYDHARVAVSALQAAGIPASIADVHMHHVYPSLEFGAFRTRILIPPACRAEAAQIMDQARASQHPALYPCPVCGAETRTRKRIISMIIMTLLGCFFPFKSAKRRCGACRINLYAPEVDPFTAEELGEVPVADVTPGPLGLTSFVAAGLTFFARARRWGVD